MYNHTNHIMQNSPFDYQSLNSWTHNIRHFSHICYMLNQKDELERLIKWTIRKRRLQIKKRYQHLLTELEVRLSRKMVREPKLFRYAWWFHSLCRVAFPDKRYFQKGGKRYSTFKTPQRSFNIN